MEVKVLEATPRPIDLIGSIAGTSTGKEDPSRKRVETCIRRGHLSVLENAVATLRIKDISRSCSHQLVRHRIASYCQASQRYTKLDGDIWYVTPESIENNPYYEAYKAFMESAETLYFELLDHGIKPEDARFVLPEGTKTEICMTMNLRSLFHFFDLRLDPHAQWEIRELAQRIHDELMNQGMQWVDIICLYDRFAPFEA